MYEFHLPSISEHERLREIITENQPTSCEYSVGNLLGWCSHYGAYISYIDGCLVSKIKKNDLFGFPKGENYLAALESIRKNYDYPSFYGLVDSDKKILEKLYPGEYNILPSRDNFDYVYRVSELASLSGKKYHSKRNHISYFEKNYNWIYEEINRDNLSECIEMDKKWLLMNLDRDRDGLEKEGQVLDFCFDNYDLLGFVGGLIRVDGEVVAFTFGEKLNDNTFDTHFEKAYSSVRGAYPMINREFARNTLTGYEFVNREDDVGSDGLRQAKLSYHPDRMIEKFTAVKL